jgi:simple sugar transport system permease protein
MDTNPDVAEQTETKDRAQDEASEAESTDGDERVIETSLIQRLISRPELGAAGGAVVVWVFFAVVAGNQGFLSAGGTATYLEVSAELGILAIAVALLMIGGEFDLSVGSIIGASGMLTTILSVEYGWPLSAVLVVVLAFAVLVGCFNGYLVLRTGLPSFLITLASLFIFRGSTIGLARLITGRTQVGGLNEATGYDWAYALFGADIPLFGSGFPVSIVWWIGLAALASWVLRRTQFGNWIYGVGGDAEAARNTGVPVRKVKLTLFVLTAVAASLVGVIQAISFSGADALRGELREFYAIIVVVIGGVLLTGGYGTIIGVVFGALIFGMVRQGIVFTGVDADWFQVFLGGMLLIAVLVNNWVRQQAMESQ